MAQFQLTHDENCFFIVDLDKTIICDKCGCQNVKITPSVAWSGRGFHAIRFTNATKKCLDCGSIKQLNSKENVAVALHIQNHEGFTHDEVVAANHVLAGGA